MDKTNFIQASDVADFVYCQRVWWYRLKGYKSDNKQALQEGTRVHENITKKVDQVKRTSQIGKFLLLIALLMIAATLIVLLLLPS